ncbi:MAG: GNAT family N-acetyltransferase [Alphaproteobacteria bacterium]|nr:GNAT family N-acetyltransferase [Alphaproteobacteria bacterium]
MTPTLTAPGIVLRPLALADAPALFVALSDPQVQLYRRALAHTSLAETEAYIADTLGKSRAAWAITANGGEALGRLALRVTEPESGEFGIVIRAEAQGRGLGLKAIALAEGFAFGDLNLRILRANIDAENVASKALFARAGFRTAAHLTADRASERGPRDSVIMEKVRA